MCSLACGRFPRGKTQLRITPSSGTAPFLCFRLQTGCLRLVFSPLRFIKRVPPQASRPCLSKVVFLSSASVPIFCFFQKYCLLLFKTFYSGKISSIHKSRENSIVKDHDVTSTVINSYPILFLLYFPSLPPTPKIDYFESKAQTSYYFICRYFHVSLKDNESFKNITQNHHN